jgi:superfamily I DNA/RNA helicase/mRNA-degrading endonuclease RelE of RelBE toxin-antitoxin system
MSVLFRIADTFSTSLSRLALDEQKLAKTTAFDLQMNPANPGHQFHKLDRARDPRLWSVRVSSDIRIIVHRSDDSLLLCYVDHHDDAYRWAERRKIEVHPKTGAAQIVEIRELVQEVYVPRFIEAVEATAIPVAVPRIPGPPLFAGRSRDDLHGFGVPQEWIDEVLAVDEDGLFDLASHLPAEAAEALLELATGSSPVVSKAENIENPFEHPDALRRFRTMENVEELREALDFPMEKWSIFLHPSQREIVERQFSGPARVSGSAGTGKTVVALHRATHLLKKYPEARVLLTTFSPALASQLKTRMRRLLAANPRLGERLEVADFDAVAARLHQVNGGQKKQVSRSDVERRIREAAKSKASSEFSDSFLEREWWEIIDSLQVRSWDSYRDVKRLGRKIRLPEEVRRKAWEIFESVLEGLVHDGLETSSGMFRELTEAFQQRNRAPFDFVIVDEAQDVSMPQLRFLASLKFDSEEALFFSGDIGQRVFQYPFSWLSQGVDVRGRSKALKVNYRTSHQIRSRADLLLNESITDGDGNSDDRSGAVSTFDGPAPEVQTFATPEEEAEFVATWLQTLPGDIQPHEVAIIVRDKDRLEVARSSVSLAKMSSRLLDETTEPEHGKISLSTMHSAKGLEFKAVAVMCLNDDVIPSPERISETSDPSDIEEIYSTERQLLYVACTRAREHLLLTSSGRPSEFLVDIAS